MVLLRRDRDPMARVWVHGVFIFTAPVPRHLVSAWVDPFPRADLARSALPA